MRRCSRTIFLIIAFCCFLLHNGFSQLGKITVDLEKDKPEEYKEKLLKSERTGEKKFTIPRRIMNNTTSHYNYFFNANNKLNAVIERARMANKDNYAKLIPFYGYSLTNTATQGTELDSVIYKCTAGILLHDLRSNWVDNLYLLIGKAYLLRKYFDSASMTFQFINYNLYPNRKMDDDQVVVGSNDNGGSSMSIANKEKRSILAKAFTLPPSRNDALVWQVRTSIEREEYPDAAGLINTLQNDPNFPKRLKPNLEEVNAYWFYKQGIYDSAASHLEKALGNAEDKEDKARWEFLLAQLFEVTDQRDKASQYYEKAAKHTTDQLMDIYANLNNAKMYKGTDIKGIDRSIAGLLHMVHKDKFENYRDIIYFSAGELAMDKPDTSEAVTYYKKSIKYNNANISYKNRAFLSLGNISFKRKQYRVAQAMYDSLQMSDTSLLNPELIAERKSILTKLVANVTIIEHEDSLQKLAAMNPADLEAYLKKLSKKLAKERGTNDDDNSNSTASRFTDTKNLSPDLFSNNSNTSGTWYFYNPSLKAQGFNDFKSKWGKRINIDNWRRRSSIDASINNQTIKTNTDSSTLKKNGNNGEAPSDDVSFESMLSNIPTTPEKLKVSNNLVINSLFELGKIYQNNLEDYALAAETYETSLARYPDSLHGGELYLNLYFCYQKMGNPEKANYYKDLLNSKFKNTAYNQMLTNPKKNIISKKDPAATKKYEEIYNLFLEGNFAQAVSEKKVADSLYGNNYWSPQLLYIESIYYIRQKQDSQAINILNNIVNQYSASPLKVKAVNMIAVLKKRSEIETFLTGLQVTRMTEDSITSVGNGTLTPELDTTTTKSNVIAKKDNVKQVVVKPTDKPAAKEAPVKSGKFVLAVDAEQYVVMVLNKVDPVYINEAKNALNRYNSEKYANQQLTINKDVLEKDINMLVFRKFPDAGSAVLYAQKIKKDAVSEISWLPAAKYTFIVISESNLLVLKENKDLSGYRSLLNSKFPGKF